MKTVIIQEEPIDIAHIMKETGTEADGAVVTFVGRVRDSARGKSVLRIEYEVYDNMARKEIRKIVDDAFEKWGIGTCTVAHRYGPVAIGEPSIVIAVSSPHRAEAFHATQYIIDTVKKTVPIWKKEFYSDGSSWIHDRS